MNVLPGDPAYGEQVVVPQLEALFTRLTEGEATIQKLGANVEGVAGMITALELADSPEVSELLERFHGPAIELLEQAHTISSTLLRLSGIELDGEDVVSDDHDDTTDPAADDAGSHDSKLGVSASIATMPPELGHVRFEEVRRLLGKRMYGLGKEELEKNPTLFTQASSIVAVSPDGLELSVEGGQGQGAETTDLSSTTIRAINMYIRLHVAGVQRFQKKDVTDRFGPEPNGFANMKFLQETNALLRQQLGIPALYGFNGELRANARYWPSGMVVFMQHNTTDRAGGNVRSVF